MFERILVAIDGSVYSREAVPAAIEIAQKFGSEVFVLHVAEHDKGRSVTFSTESPAEATRLVAEAVKQVRDEGISSKGKLVDRAVGHVAAAIIETAATESADLIVMGSRGLSDVQGFMLGSVTHNVMQRVMVPVLVVRPAKEAGLEVAAAGAIGPHAGGS